MKVVYNNCFGGFSLSEAGMRRYAEIKGMELYPERGKFGFTTYWTVPPEQRPKELEGKDWEKATHEERVASNEGHRRCTISTRDFERDDPVLVQVVEELGDKANGQCAALAIENVQAGSRWRIDEYDGNERVMTNDAYEWKVAAG